MDRERSALVTKRSNAGELIEKRANAFATAFLLPDQGVRQLLLEADKGHASRREHVAFDAANERAISAKLRSVAGSQVVTYQDALAVAVRFGTSYAAAVCRLLALAVLSESDAERLLTERCVAAAETHRRIFDVSGADASRENDDNAELREIKAEIVRLTIEAYRRRIINRAALTATAARLHLPALSPEGLIELAEAAWQ